MASAHLLRICIFAGAFLSVAAHAAASPVLVMDRAGRVHAREDPALPPRAAEPVPAGAIVASAPPARRAAGRTVRGELKRMLAAGQIDAITAQRDRATFETAIRAARRLRGMRRAELAGVIANLHEIAARGALTPSRLPQLFLTLERNRQWWTSGQLLSYGQRVEFSDSELVWEEYPGEGIELQALGTFGKANGLWMAKDDTKLRTLLDEMVPLAAQRGPAIAWEYDFDFDAGAPPWTSGLSQATGIQALARASRELDDPAYLDAAKRALPLFSLAPPLGVRQRTALGARYLIYSFAPGQRVVNAFVQALVGLYDYAQIAGDAGARRLFRAGDRQARADVAAADTGAWSLYQLGGAESDLSYHELLTGFLRNLCTRTRTPVYCDTAQRFGDDLKTPPSVSLVTARVRAKSSALVRFRLSKVSRVGMTIRHGDATALATSATVSHGSHAYAWTVPKVPGSYDVTLVATDLAGNVGRGSGTIEVLARKPKRAARARRIDP